MRLDDFDIHELIPFNFVDSDKNGVLSINEVSKFIKDKLDTSIFPGEIRGGALALFQKMGQHIQNKTVGMIRTADHDKDGGIDRSEYRTMIKERGQSMKAYFMEASYRFQTAMHKSLDIKLPIFEGETGVTPPGMKQPMPLMSVDEMGNSVPPGPGPLRVEVLTTLPPCCPHCESGPNGKPIHSCGLPVGFVHP
jgi:hypothetical protein